MKSYADPTHLWSSSSNADSIKYPAAGQGHLHGAEHGAGEQARPPRGLAAVRENVVFGFNSVLIRLMCGWGCWCDWVDNLIDVWVGVVGMIGLVWCSVRFVVIRWTWVDVGRV